MTKNNDSILDGYILPPQRLLEGCPLDYYNPIPVSTHTLNDLGALEQLPTEIQLKVFATLDLKTFLIFRAVCRKARGLTNSVQGFNKIMRHEDTANVIRMAVGIDVAHRNTVEEVFSTLCQDTCETADCNKLAPYVDVFHLRRLCLGCGIGCRFRHVAQTASGMKKVYGLDDSQVAGLPRFRVIPGFYDADIHWQSDDLCDRMFDGVAAAQLSSKAPDTDITCQQNQRHTLVRASLLNAKSTAAQGFFSCCRCVFQDEDYYIDLRRDWLMATSQLGLDPSTDQPVLQRDPEEYGITICLGRMCAQHANEAHEDENFEGSDVW